MVAAAGAGCAVDKQDAPALAGPSEIGTSLTLYASPDTLRQDGASQSQITIQAQDSKGAALRSLPIRLDVAVGGTVVDFGQLSGKNLVTGSDGRATATYTAPTAPADSVDTQTIVQIVATPVGTDYNGALSRAVSIRLVPPGVIQAPNGTPTAAFTYSPSAPMTKSDVTFDASLSSDADGSIASYAWNFGDGSSGSGVLAKHSYSNDGSYTATLTVTDDRGLSASLSKTITVALAPSPTAAFAVSPSSPKVNDQVFFNAGLSTAAPGRSIVSYKWDYGSGRQDSGVLVWQIYTQPGDYTVVLTVTDDAGRTGSTTKTVTVGGAGITAAFTITPTAPTNGTTVYFSAATSSATKGISSYAWDFGDGTTGSGVSTSHVFRCPGGPSTVPFVVQLTVKDSAGSSASTSKEVPVTFCGA
jgi:PKD repeat protein